MGQEWGDEDDPDDERAWVILHQRQAALASAHARLAYELGRLIVELGGDPGWEGVRVMQVAARYRYAVATVSRDRVHADELGHRWLEAWSS